MRYHVEITGVFTTEGYVDADSQDEADELAAQAYYNGEFDADSEVGQLFVSAELEE